MQIPKCVAKLQNNTVDELIEVLEKYKGKEISLMGSSDPIHVLIENDIIILDEMNLEDM